MLQLVWLSFAVGVCLGDFLNQKNITFDCNRQDGAVWWGCGSFGVCRGGQYLQQDCLGDTVFNRDSLQPACTHRNNAPFPCGNRPNCNVYVKSPGHRIPETQGQDNDGRPPCSYYYTCSYGRFLGYQACPNGTVYFEAEQRCEEPQRVPPPCGTGPDSPSGQGQNPFGQGQSPFGQDQNLFGQGQNPFGQGQNPFGQGQNPFDQGQNRNPFAGNRGGLQGSGQGQGYGNMGGQGTGYGSGRSSNNRNGGSGYGVGGNNNDYSGGRQGSNEANVDNDVDPWQRYRL